MKLRSYLLLAVSTVALTACGGGGGSSDAGGGDAPPTVTLSSSPASVVSGSASNLSWSSSGASSCTASGAWSGTKALSGSESTGALQSAKTYTLTCGGAGGTTIRSVDVAVTTPAPTLSFSASPTTVSSGGSTTLTWSATDATSCTASGGWSGAKATSGSQTISGLAATTTFTLDCTGAGGSVSKSATVTVTATPPAPTVTLSANPTSVVAGSTTQLTWSSTNATSCSATGGWTGARATSGAEVSAAINANTTFTLTCSGTGGSGNASVTVTAGTPPPPPSVSLSASPTSIASGGSSTLTWSSTNATSCTASGGWSGSKTLSGSLAVTATATTTYTLACTGSGGSASKSATVTVVPAPTVTLSASPASIASGASSTLTWSTTNATSCTASGGWSGSKATSGSQSITGITATATYTLSCSGTGGSASKSATVTVVPAPAVTLTASPTSVSSGGSSTLTWSTTNATSCTASGGWSGTKATSGSQSITGISATTTYTLACTGTGGSTSKSATVTVTAAAPTVSLTANPVTVASGGSSTLSWTTTNATSCTASGAWTGSKATSGSEATGALTSSSAYTLTCTGSGGTANDSITVTVGTTAGPVFPLHVEAGKRYLVDAAGAPFFIHGDTPWDLAAMLKREDVDVYLENRRLKGFNTILIEMMEHKYSTNPPYNAYGDPPFTVAGDFSTPYEPYFAHVEYVVSQAAAKGMLVMITPAYMGYLGGDQGWYQEMVANGETKLRAYGQYLANRFKAYNNIVWVQGGDFNPPEKLLLRAIANGIRDVTPSALQTFHGAPESSALGFLGSSEPWLSINDTYTYDAVVTSAFTEYQRSTMPFYLIESRYENEANGTETLIRSQAYQSVLSGASGHLYGNNPLWFFGTGWQTAMNAPGATTLVRLKNLMTSFAWWTLVPDTGNTFLTAGVGSGSSRAVASLASTGAFALLYMPSSRAITVTMSRLSGPHVRARWYDPTNGAYTTVAGSPFTNTGAQSFTPSGNNSRGFGDWVLVLESVP